MDEDILPENDLKKQWTITKQFKFKGEKNLFFNVKNAVMIIKTFF